MHRLDARSYAYFFFVLAWLARTRKLDLRRLRLGVKDKFNIIRSTRGKPLERTGIQTYNREILTERRFLVPEPYGLGLEQGHKNKSDYPTLSVPGPSSFSLAVCLCGLSQVQLQNSKLKTRGRVTPSPFRSRGHPS